MWVAFLLMLLLLPLTLSVHAEDLGELSANPYHPNSTSKSLRSRKPLQAGRHQQSLQSLWQSVQ